MYPNHIETRLTAKGDKRVEKYIVINRIVESKDSITTDYSRIPHKVLDEITRRKTGEKPEIVMIIYSITSKQLSTIEQCKNYILLIPR